SIGLVENIFQSVFELGMNRSDRLQPVLAQRIVGVRVGTHRTWTIKRDQSRDVAEVIRLHQTHERSHGPAVELEDSERIAAREKLIGRPILQFEVLEIDLLSPVRTDVVESVRDDGEVAQ